MDHSAGVGTLRYESLADAIRGQALPLIMVDLDAFDANIAEVRRLAQGTPVRVASKSIRCTDLLRRVLASGAPFAGVMAYSIHEACDLLDAGFHDVLVAYPSLNAASLARAASYASQGKSLILMTDSPKHLDAISHAASQAHTTLEVCIDVDMSTDFGPLHFGVDRSPLSSPDDVGTLARYAKQVPGVRVVGMMGYEAQIAGVPDRTASGLAKSVECRLVRELKKRSMPTIAKRRAAAVKAIEQLWGKLRIVNAGGSGSLHTSRLEPVVTEITAGSAFYAPQLFDHYDALSVTPSMLFALEVVRTPKSATYTCLGGGYIASGETGPDRAPSIVAPATGSLVKHQGAGEVQTPVAFEVDPKLALGAPIFFRHAKAGELCERFADIVLVQNGLVIGQVPTYRGEGKTYL